MTREERAAIIRKANETLRRSREELRTAESMRPPPDQRREFLTDEVDDAPLKYRVTSTPAIEHKCPYSHQGAASPADRDDNYWDGWERWLRNHLRRERRLTNESVGAAISELLAREREDYRQQLSDEVRQLRIELSNLESTISELRSVVNAERAVIDLPPLLRRAN